MTKKDYIAIAEVLRELGNAGVRSFDSAEDCIAIAHAFADILQRDNPRFDRARFVLACVPKASNGLS